jgi:hypothetical protein
VGCEERDDRWGPHVGERGEGLAGSGWFWVSWAGWLPGCGPSGLLASFFYFFSFCFPFSFVLISVFGFFLKKLFYSDLNKIKADHFWSLKSVFTT